VAAQQEVSRDQNIHLAVQLVGSRQEPSRVGRQCEAWVGNKDFDVGS